MQWTGIAARIRWHSHACVSSFITLALHLRSSSRSAIQVTFVWHSHHMGRVYVWVSSEKVVFCCCCSYLSGAIVVGVVIGLLYIVVTMVRSITCCLCRSFIEIDMFGSISTLSLLNGRFWMERGKKRQWMGVEIRVMFMRVNVNMNQVSLNSASLSSDWLWVDCVSHDWYRLFSFIYNNNKNAACLLVDVHIYSVNISVSVTKYSVEFPTKIRMLR